MAVIWSRPISLSLTADVILPAARAWRLPNRAAATTSLAGIFRVIGAFNDISARIPPRTNAAGTIKNRDVDDS